MQASKQTEAWLECSLMCPFLPAPVSEVQGGVTTQLICDAGVGIGVASSTEVGRGRKYPPLILLKIC